MHVLRLTIWDLVHACMAYSWTLGIYVCLRDKRVHMDKNKIPCRSKELSRNPTILFLTLWKGGFQGTKNSKHVTKDYDLAHKLTSKLFPVME